MVLCYYLLRNTRTIQVLGVEKKKTKDGKLVDRNEPKKTKVVHNNGFNPEWKEKFEFKVHLPDLALLEIQAWFSCLNNLQNNFQTKYPNKMKISSKWLIIILAKII